MCTCRRIQRRFPSRFSSPKVWVLEENQSRIKQTASCTCWRGAAAAPSETEHGAYEEESNGVHRGRVFEIAITRSSSRIATSAPLIFVFLVAKHNLGDERCAGCRHAGTHSDVRRALPCHDASPRAPRRRAAGGHVSVHREMASSSANGWCWASCSVNSPH